VDVQGNTVILTGPQEAINQAREVVTTVDTRPARAARRNLRSQVFQRFVARRHADRRRSRPSSDAIAELHAAVRYAANAGHWCGLGGSSGGGSFGGGSGTGSSSSTGRRAERCLLTFGHFDHHTAVVNIRARSLILIGRMLTWKPALRLLQSVDIAPAQVEIERGSLT
jgi:type II secretory pathway component GspD/PulD (secretin)